MPLDPGTARMLQDLAARGVPPMSAGTPVSGRAVLRRMAALRDPATVPAVAAVESIEAGGVPARVYRPDAAAPLPTVVYLHGGGFVVGDLDTHDAAARGLAVDVGAVVVSVDYALAPEHPFPAGVDDAWSALADVARRVDAFGGDPRRLVVGGDSAGAGLAAVSAIRARDEGLDLAAQLLLYPTVDPAGDHASRAENAEGYFLTSADMAWFTEQYIGVPAESAEARAIAADWRISPLRAPSLAGLAPAVVATAEYDPLRDEGVAYAAALEAAGVRVLAKTYPGLIHGFYGQPIPGPAAATAEVHAMLRALL